MIAAPTRYREVVLTSWDRDMSEYQRQMTAAKRE